MTEPCDLSAVEARRLIGRKALSPVELTDSCIARIEAVDGAVNAMVTRCFERAREEAKTAEEAVSRGDELGVLHGLPMGVKDLNVTEGVLTTYGSPIHAENVPAEDERIIAALRRAGAIVIGKTNTPEFGAGANTKNAVFGATGNPFDPTRICGGSSGGSAVALATGMAPICTGSDTGGSLRTPASFCGVVSHRGTPGLVPSDKRGIGLTTYNVQGPMARNVADTSLMLAAMAGNDPCDPLSGPVDANSFVEVEEVDLSQLRVAWSTDLGCVPVDNDIARIFEERVGKIASSFKSCERRDPDMARALDVFWVIRGVGFLAGRMDAYRNTPELLGPNVTSNVEAALKMTAKEIGWASAEQTAIYRRFQSFFDDVDVLLCPGNSVPPFPVEQLYCDEINGKKTANYVEWLGIASAVTLTGHPVTLIPTGLDHTGTPLGMQVVGPRRHADRFTIGVASAIERVLQVMADTRRPIPDLERLSK
ncbi:MAG: amidase family protein [Pseudomonadota bacterium]|nr:amidase family protein [Pseudomonadota bacterium]